MDISKALQFYNPLAEWSCGETYDSLKWHSLDIPKPTEQELLDLWEQYKAFRAKNAYQDYRKLEYPPIEEQLDLLWHAMDSGTLPNNNNFYTTLKIIKDKYPKPQE